MKPTIGITMGDPNGIGPEIVLKALYKPSFRNRCRFVVFCDEVRLRQVSKKVFGRKIPPVQYINLGTLAPNESKWGGISKQAGFLSGRFIEAAIKSAQKGFIDAVVTAPINKESFKLGGWGKRFVGHTEMFASLTHSKSVALMLVCGSIRAVHATSHVPFKRVPFLINKNRIFETIKLTYQGLKQMGFRHPRIAVCGLNPHAGENGLLGGEEESIILPAIRMAQKKKISVKGPLPADTVWPLVRDKVFDAGIAMYHDQGQIPIKLMGFKAAASKKFEVHGVNVTLGLPIIRTSVAHGTAFEIAGKGIASEQSMVEAIELAISMASKR